MPRVPTANLDTNVLEKQVVGNKADSPKTTLASTASLASYEKGILELLRDYLALTVVDIGSIFYVDGGSTGPADNDEDGLTRATPKGSLTAALALCASGNNDVIVVLNYGSAGRGLETSFPVTVSKDMVHIVGMGNPAQKWCTMKVAAGSAGDSAHAALKFTGNRCSVHNMELGGGDTAAAITIDGSWGTWINDCWFGITGDTVGRDGIEVAAGKDAPYTTITGCEFGKHLTNDGIIIAGNCTRGTIGKPGRGNLFNKVPGIAIHTTGPTESLSIHDNKIALPADTKGKDITLNHASNTGGMINGNVANYGVTAATNATFLDKGSNHWLLNYKNGITASMPVTS